MTIRPALRSAAVAALLALGATTQLAAQIVATPEAPSAAIDFQLTPEPGKVDFGEAFQGEKLEREVVFTNTGAKAFPVQRIQTSCGCTVAKLYGPDGAELPVRAKANNEPIVVLAPGDEMRTKVEFNTAGKHGLVQQKMQVHHVDPKVAPASVDVAVRVSQGIEVSPPFVNFGTTSKNERVEQVVTLSSLDIGDWTIEGFESQIESQPLPAWLRFEVLPKDEKDTSNDVKLKVVLEGERPVGSISPRVRIVIDHDRIHSAEFMITGIVQPNVKFNSGEEVFAETLNFEKFGPEDKVTRTLKITNTDPSVPYVLESADLLTTKKEFFTTAVREIEAGVSYEVDVTVDGAIGDPFFRGSLVLKAQHPDVPSKMIPFHGWVNK